MHIHGEKAMWAQSKKVAICKPGREPALEAKLTDHSDLRLLELVENRLVLFKPPSLWYALWQPELRQVWMPESTDPGRGTLESVCHSSYCEIGWNSKKEFHIEIPEGSR